jgi:hypothetical protein
MSANFRGMARASHRHVLTRKRVQMISNGIAGAFWLDLAAESLPLAMI